MNAAAEYAAHQREHDDALRRIAEGDAWLAWWSEGVALWQPQAEARTTREEE